MPEYKSTRFAPVHTARESDRRAIVNPFLGRKPGWWDGVDTDALVNDALVYVELEDAAKKVRTFKIDLVDSLMQTPEYATAIIRASQPQASTALIRQRIEARTRRQARLNQANALHLEAIITEGALRIQVGGHETMRRQLDHLLELSALPNVDLWVVPASGAYPAMGTPFYILSFDSRYPDVGYVELLDTGVYLEEPDDLALYATRFADLRAAALDQEESRELIAAIGSSQS